MRRRFGCAPLPFEEEAQSSRGARRLPTTLASSCCSADPAEQDDDPTQEGDPTGHRGSLSTTTPVESPASSSPMSSCRMVPRAAAAAVASRSRAVGAASWQQGCGATLFSTSRRSARKPSRQTSTFVKEMSLQEQRVSRAL